MKCRARMTAHHRSKQNKSREKETKRNWGGKKVGSRQEFYPAYYKQRKCDPKQRQLTGSLVFDEEQLEALLESVLIHKEFYLHPKRRTERNRQRQKR